MSDLWESGVTAGGPTQAARTLNVLSCFFLTGGALGSADWGGCMVQVMSAYSFCTVGDALTEAVGVWLAELRLVVLCMLCTVS